MKVILLYLGWMVVFAIAYFTGLALSPYIVEKLFPKWSMGKQAAVGLLSYLFLTGVILIILGNFL